MHSPAGKEEVLHQLSSFWNIIKGDAFRGALLHFDIASPSCFLSPQIKKSITNFIKGDYKIDGIILFCVINYLIVVSLKFPSFQVIFYND